MKLREQLEKMIGSYVAIDLAGNSSAKGKLAKIEEDYLIISTSGSGEVYVAIDKILKIWETL